MAVNAITRAANTSATDPLAATVAAAGSNANVDKNAFLKLLVTQLTNQDPLAPQDQSQFLAQLAQFSSVEGINNLNSSSTHTQAADLLGKTVAATIVENGVQSDVSGKVSSVRWDANGTYLTLDSTPNEITIDQVTQVTSQ